MKTFIAAAALALLTLGAQTTDATAAPAPVVTQLDSTPDWIAAQPDAPVDAAQHTDLLSATYTLSVDPRPSRRMLTLTYELAELDPSLTYELGVVFRHKDQTAQVFSSLQGRVWRRDSINADVILWCGRSHVSVTGNTVTQTVPYSCLPFHNGEFSAYAGTFASGKGRALYAWDSIPTYTRHMSFSLSR